MGDFEPRIIGFLCNWCSYAGADKAGSAQKTYSANVTFVRLMCSGRVEPEFALDAFMKGADGVLILGCHPGDCHYKDGNIKARGRYELLLRLLEQFGIEPARCLMDYVSASEGEKFVKIVENFSSKIKTLGPIRPGNRV